MRVPYKGGACRVTSPFGPRILNGKEGFHAGIDLVTVNDDKRLYAPCDGVVVQSRIVPKSTGDDTWEWGNYVCIKTDDGYQVYMCHMDERKAAVGQRVTAGETILGIQGNTGYSFGSHCHFEVRRNGAVVNPAPLLGIPNEVGVYYTQDPSLKYKTGDVVYFSGSQQYYYSSSANPVAASPCKAKVTDTYPKGKHPYHVVGDTVYGWVNRTDITEASGDPVRVIAYRLNVRKGPGMGYNITRVLNKDDVVFITEVSANGWGKLSSGDGWISLQYVKRA